MAALRTIIPILTLVLLSFTLSEAKEYVVGGRENSWFDASYVDTLNHWAEECRFIVGDILNFGNETGAESVLEVTKEDYKSCNTSNPIAEHNTTKIELDRSGPFYFIGSSKESCKKGQNMTVIVLSDRHRHHSPVATPTPAPAETTAPEPDTPTPNCGDLGLKGGLAGILLGIGSLVAGMVLV